MASVGEVGSAEPSTLEQRNALGRTTTAPDRRDIAAAFGKPPEM